MTVTTNDRLLVVGASYAGLHLAVSAREHGWAGPITMLSAESWAPYDRPPLSKAFLMKGSAPAELTLRGKAFYDRHDIDLHLSTRVVDIDHHRRRAFAQGGQVLDYRALAIATGSTPRRLTISGSELEGVHHLATLDDALELRSVLPRVEDVVVIGAGFIGLEIAATLAALGRRVTVLEAASRVMSRVVSPTMSRFLDALHRERGVGIHLDETCAEILGEGGRVTGVRTRNGGVFAADLVLVGIGSVPRTSLAEQCGARLAGGPGTGILVDSAMRTTVPDLVAAGDCAAFVSPYAGSDDPIRLESVQNATDQGRVAGATISGGDLRYDAAPWFWSDQYDVRLQLAGVHHSTAREVVRGDPAGMKFSIVHLDRADRVVAVDSVNAPADHVAARRLVAHRARVDERMVRESLTPLKNAVRTDPDPTAAAVAGRTATKTRQG